MIINWFYRFVRLNANLLRMSGREREQWQKKNDQSTDDASALMQWQMKWPKLSRTHTANRHLTEIHRLMTSIRLVSEWQRWTATKKKTNMKKKRRFVFNTPESIWDKNEERENKRQTNTSSRILTCANVFCVLRFWRTNDLATIC